MASEASLNWIADCSGSILGLQPELPVQSVFNDQYILLIKWLATQSISSEYEIFIELKHSLTIWYYCYSNLLNSETIVYL